LSFFSPGLFYSGERFVESESPHPLQHVGPIEGPVLLMKPVPMFFGELGLYLSLW
jgi:hypothetical protein